MSKERLEEIKQILRMAKEEKFIEDFYVIIKLFEMGHAEWLIEQAERFEVLSEQHDEALKQNKRYREAIDRALREGIEIEDCNKAIDQIYGILGIELEESQ